MSGWRECESRDLCADDRLERDELQAECARLRNVLAGIAAMPEENSEWEAVDLYETVRQIANDALIEPTKSSTNQGGE